MTNTTTAAEMQDVLTAVERIIDDHPDLTRSRYGSAFVEEAEIKVTRRGVTVSVNVRHARARGRGSRLMMSAHGAGATVTEAFADFMRNLPFFTQALER